MLLLLHIVIALASMVAAGMSFFAPSTSKLRLSYILTALTLISGTYLVVSRHAALLQACITGILYVSINYIAIYMARRKLAALSDDNSSRQI